MNIGNHRTYHAHGLSIVANHCIVFGNNCRVTGNHNTVGGDNCHLTGNHNFVKGHGCSVTGNHNRSNSSCIVAGSFNTTLDSWQRYVDEAPYQHDLSDEVQTWFGGQWFGGQPRFINNFNIAEVGSISSDGQIALRCQTLQVGEITVTLTNVQAQSIEHNGSNPEITVDGIKLVCDGARLLVNDKVLALERVFPNQKQIILEWSQFQQRLPELTRTLFTGEDHETDDQAKACSICLTNEKCCAAIPCGHQIFCIACANHYDQSKGCPLCREPIIMINKIFA